MRSDTLLNSGLLPIGSGRQISFNPRTRERNGHPKMRGYSSTSLWDTRLGCYHDATSTTVNTEDTNQIVSILFQAQAPYQRTETVHVALGLRAFVCHFLLRAAILGSGICQRLSFCTGSHHLYLIPIALAFPSTSPEQPEQRLEIHVHASAALSVPRTLLEEYSL